MRVLRKNSFLLYIFLLIGCANSSYRVEKENGSVQIYVSADRVLPECEFIYDYSGEDKDAYGFMIHILDEQNTVLTVAQNNILGKSSCYERYHAVEKILKGTHPVIGGFGDLDRPRKQQGHFYEFSNKKRFQDNGRVLQFGVVWNDEGQCFDAMRGTDSPCPDFPFPWDRYKEVRSDKKTQP